MVRSGREISILKVLQKSLGPAAVTETTLLPTGRALRSRSSTSCNNRCFSNHDLPLSTLMSSSGEMFRVSCAILAGLSRTAEVLVMRKNLEAVHSGIILIIISGDKEYCSDSLSRLLCLQITVTLRFWEWSLLWAGSAIGSITALLC